MIKLGVIGLSEGNGHPYSWSAIFNGYDWDYMKDCPWEVIPQYLSQQTFPDDAIANATVTHIWTQDKVASEHIAKSANIPNVVEQMEDLIGVVDAVLLARDDPENHYSMSKPFIEAGIPVFIDKPISTSVEEAQSIFDLAKYDSQIFTCSSLRYAHEFQLTNEELAELGEIRLVEATIPKSWTKYAVHIIEPVLNIIGQQGKPSKITNTGGGEINITTVEWETGILGVFKVLGTTKCPLAIQIYGSKGFKNLVFKDTYYAFKSSLEAFIQTIQTKKRSIPTAFTLEVVEIIERGFLK
jgi:predicted dehydrogenase